MPDDVTPTFNGTTLADLVQNVEFANYFYRSMLERSALIRSGIAAEDPIIAQKVAAGGKFEGTNIKLPSVSQIDTSSDSEVPVENKEATPDKVTAEQEIAAIQYRRKTFAITDVASTMSSADPAMHIMSQLVPYWNNEYQKIIINSLTGIFASDDGEDSMFDISGETGTAAVLTKDTILLGAQLLGDRKSELTAVAMNSAVETYLASLDTNASLYRASEGAAQLSQYNGRDIIVDDTIPYDADTKIGVIYLFGRGAFTYNNLPVPHAFEAERKAGVGCDYIHTWVRSIIHPRGWNWAGTPAGLAPTNAELATGANWERKFEVKRVPIAMVKFLLP